MYSYTIHNAKRVDEGKTLALASLKLGPLYIQGVHVRLKHNALQLVFPQPRSARPTPTYQIDTDIESEIALSILQVANKNRLQSCA